MYSGTKTFSYIRFAERVPLSPWQRHVAKTIPRSTHGKFPADSKMEEGDHHPYDYAAQHVAESGFSAPPEKKWNYSTYLFGGNAFMIANFLAEFSH
jgi:hypothetical protein